MIISNFLLDILAFGAIISGILVITSKNPIISVLFLISVFVHSACYLLVLGVGFVGLSYLIIYVGAITVLFLFVIMMINIKLVDLLETGSEYTKNLPLGLILTGLFFYEMLTISPINLNYDSIFYLPFGILNFINSLFVLNSTHGIYNLEFDINLFSTSLTGIDNNFLLNTDYSNGILSSIFDLADNYLFTFLQIEMLAQGLYTYSSILLIIIGIVLFLAMFGPIILSIRINKNEN